MTMKIFKLHVETINEVLPQTQCKLCTYEGCKPYATAIVEHGDQIDRCLPGGVRVLKKLAELTHQDITPYLATMQTKQKPQLVAKIREAECIGCTLCIQACPVDAILGAAKQMHTIMSDECTGCELCLAPCPVDCIDLLELGPTPETDSPVLKKKAVHARRRYEFHQTRLQKEKQQNQKKHQLALKINTSQRETSLIDKKQAIAAAVARVLQKKNQNSDND